jgi:glycosyltransferase involved in cell wall biosynthesis
MNLTVVIPTKNRVELTLKAISSCLTIPVINEILVVDDYSKPENAHLLKKKSDFKNVHIIKNTSHPGALSARIFGANLSKNEYIVYLDSDDELCSDGINANFVYICDHVDVGLVYSNVIHGSKPTNWLQISGFERGRILKNLSLCSFSGMMVRKCYIKKCEFISTLPAWQDDEFCLQISKYCKIQFRPGIVAVCSISGARISSSKRRQLDGLRLLFNKYKSDIIKKNGLIALPFWKIRLLSLILLVVSEERDSLIMQKYYNFLGRLLRKFTKVYFDRIYV